MRCKRGTSLRADRARIGAVSLAIVVGLAWWVVGAWPYELTYANPLLGGNPAAHHTIASGWGEGLDQAAGLSERPARRPGASRLRMPGEIYTTVLDAQLNGTVAPAEGADAGAYDALVVYLRNNQLGERPPFFDDELLRWEPEHTVTLSGVDVRLDLRHTRPAPVGAQFGDMLALDGYGLDTASPRIGRRLEATAALASARTRWPGGVQVASSFDPRLAASRGSRHCPSAGDPATPLASR